MKLGDREKFDERFDGYVKKARNRALVKAFVPLWVYIAGVGVIAVTYGWKLSVCVLFISWSMAKYIDFRSSGGAYKMISDEVIALAMEDKENNPDQDGPIGFKD